MAQFNRLYKGEKKIGYESIIQFNNETKWGKKAKIKKKNLFSNFFSIRDKVR